MALENKSRLDWIDGLKAFAIIGILLNHTVELFGPGPWFSNPSYDWPDLQTRLANIFPQGDNAFVNVISFLGWLGDMGPGVFIFVSGFTLTFSSIKKGFTTIFFYKKRFLRIYPLYITIHIVINIFVILIGEWDTNSIISKPNLLSLLGLRFMDSLFFHLNPSWWFIWVIIQFYLVFPFLFKFLIKNTTAFIIVTFFITILSRLAGILEFTYTNDLYYWMTGLFGGTRLFEFTIGMYFAYEFSKEESWFTNNLKNPLKVFIICSLIYIVGFMCSLTYLGSLFSNILITIGLSGMFYSMFSWLAINKGISSFITYIGNTSFFVYLIHQPIMMYIASINTGIIIRIVFLFSLIVLMFLVGSKSESLINNSFNRLIGYGQTFLKKLSIRLLRIAFLFMLVYTIVGSIIISVYNPENLLNFFKASILFFIGIASLYCIKSIISCKKLWSFTLVSIIIAIVFFILPGSWLIYYNIAIILALISYFITERLFTTNFIQFIIPLVIVLLLTAVSEIYLQKYRPVELSSWGELPALQTDSITTYSLIPNKTTHLRYNNYSYTLNTNSYGFASEEVDLTSKDTNVYRIFVIGDAFTMPEGMEYKHSYPFLLEKKLNEHLLRKEIQVINGGVTGYGPNEMLNQLSKYIEIVKPDLVINQFFINEFYEINLKPKERLKNIGLLSNQGNFDFLYENQLKTQTLTQYKRLFQVPDSNFVYFKSLLFLYEKKSQLYSDSVLNKFNMYFESVWKLQDTYGFDYLLLYVPGQIEISDPEYIDYFPYMYNLNDSAIFDFEIAIHSLRQICRKQNIELVDLTCHLKNNSVQPLYYSRSWHWNKSGHNVVANYLSEYLITNLFD